MTQRQRRPRGHAFEVAFVNVVESLKQIVGVVDVGRDMFQKRLDDLLEKPAKSIKNPSTCRYDRSYFEFFFVRLW